MADLYAHGRQVDPDTAKEIIARLEAHKNHIPSSRVVRREYAQALLKEYREYVESHKGDNRET